MILLFFYTQLKLGWEELDEFPEHKTWRALFAVILIYSWIGNDRIVPHHFENCQLAELRSILRGKVTAHRAGRSSLDRLENSVIWEYRGISVQ